MRWFTRRRLAALLGVLALCSSTLVLVSSMEASGTTIITPGAFGDFGVVRIGPQGSSDYIRFDKHNGTTFVDGTNIAGHKVTLSPGCNLSKTPGIITFAPVPTNAGVGLFDHSLGVKAKGEGNGTPCGRLDTKNQSLTIARDNTTNSPIKARWFDFAELDVEAKFNATIHVTISRVGGTPETFTYSTGPGSDSNPDSADLDNYRIRVPKTGYALFDTLTLRVDDATPDGAIALEGGSDGTAAQEITADVPYSLGAALGTKDSLIHVSAIDGFLDCNDPEVDETDNSDSLPETKLFRDDNATGTDEDCVPIPYALTASNDGGNETVLLQKDLGGQTTFTPQFFWTVTWQPEAASYPYSGTATQIDPDGNGPLTPVPVQWCDGSASAPVLPSSLPAGVKWCLVSQSVSLVSTGMVQQTERFYGAGDPRLLK